MTTLTTLLHTDYLLFKRWFSTQTVSKVLVIVGFLITFLSVTGILYFFSHLFFQNLATFQVYGNSTVEYLLHASLVMVLWFCIWSAIAATITLLFSSTAEQDVLITHPISSGALFGWFSLKAFILNLILFCMLFMPLLLAYQSVFSSLSLISFIFAVLLVMITVILLSQSFGILLGLLLAPLFVGRRWLAFFSGIGLFFISAFFLIQAIFPKRLMALYRAEPEDFFTVYNTLPLSSPSMPTGWLTETIISGVTSTSFLVLVSAVLFTLIVYTITDRKGIKTLQILRDRVPGHAISRNSDTFILSYFMKGRYPLLVKDIASLIRTPSEFGYAVFLYLLLLFFFLLIFQLILKQSEVQISSGSILFLYFWFMFFTIAYLLRLVFPLFVREGNATWYLFAQPLTKKNILTQKIVLGHIFLTLHIVLYVLFWFFLPLSFSFVLYAQVMGLVVVFSLLAVTFLFGFTKPHYQYHSEPEKASTSANGITSLFVSLVIVGVGGYSLYSKLTHDTSIMSIATILALVMFSIGAYYVLYTKSVKQLNQKRDI